MPSPEINEKQARSIKYQLTIAKPPLAKDLADFQFDGTLINQTLVRSRPLWVLPSNAMPFWSAVRAPARPIWPSPSPKLHPIRCSWPLLLRRRPRQCLETETRNGRQGRIAEHLTRMDFIVLDELGYLPFAQSGGELLFHLVSRLYERTPSSSRPIWPSASGQRVRRRQDDHRAARSTHPSLPHRRDRQRQLAGIAETKRARVV